MKKAVLFIITLLIVLGCTNHVQPEPPKPEIVKSISITGNDGTFYTDTITLSSITSFGEDFDANDAPVTWNVEEAGFTVTPNDLRGVEIVIPAEWIANGGTTFQVTVTCDGETDFVIVDVEDFRLINAPGKAWQRYSSYYIFTSNTYLVLGAHSGTWSTEVVDGKRYITCSVGDDLVDREYIFQNGNFAPINGFGNAVECLLVDALSL